MLPTYHTIQAALLYLVTKALRTAVGYVVYVVDPARPLEPVLPPPPPTTCELTAPRPHTARTPEWRALLPPSIFYYT